MFLVRFQSKEMEKKSIGGEKKKHKLKHASIKNIDLQNAKKEQEIEKKKSIFFSNELRLLIHSAPHHNISLLRNKLISSLQLRIF